MCLLIDYHLLQLWDKTLIEVWFGELASDYDSLHVLGSIVYYHIKEFKLNLRAKKTLFMGVGLIVKGYRLWCLYQKKIIFNRDVTFDESTMVRKVTQKDKKMTSTT